ncbi:MAG: Na+/H+ antiporter subunit E [Novosphingobium sp.]|uniref:Na+/H+ antiporter subunit E n=1 Tax=Tsuneonella sp. CC-YZS046 TaxID=3042152 RepID=UPI002D78C252|nr:Na+/H+ antiporter subunit E [Tsuneonella sp. CC-YZS046]WRO67083.1 Na+/H+ antiporter subunit E [Tsuneonella sp. CC-YZS046]
MTRLLPYPLLSLALLVMWLLLTGFSPGHLLLAAVVALVVSRAMLALKPEKPSIRFGWGMVKLAMIVLADIIRSNIAVGRIVLFRPPQRRSGFIHLPIEMRSPYGLAVLAVIITATPGTLWLQHDIQRNMILIHVLDLVDEEEWIRLIKHRYERLLMEIFE